MTELLTAAQMRAIEQAAIASGEVTGLELMERAGRGVVAAIFEEWPELAEAPGALPRTPGYLDKGDGKGAPRAVVLCGPGNNGGDGFVVARLLRERGWEVFVLLHGDPERLPPDARANYQRWCGMGKVAVDDPLDETFAHRWLDEAMYGSASGPVTATDPEIVVVVDALFGTGLTRPMIEAGHLAQYLSTFDEAEFEDLRFRIVAVDIPSGLCADSGRALSEGAGAGLGRAAVEANLTVTFHRAKPGHFLDAGPRHCGTLRVVDIGLTGEGSIALAAPARPMLGKWTGHKYSHGHALVLSGPAGHGGAARLAARGALRIGAGVVTVGCPLDAIPENAARLDAVMLRRVADGAALAGVLEDGRINALCVGPGLGLDARGREVVAVALESRGEPRSTGAAGRGSPRLSLVLDADALTILSQNPDLFAALHDRCVLTPHAGEFARLFPDIAAKLAAPATKGPAYSKVDATREAAKRAGCVVLCKGPDTVIADPTGRCAINSAHYDRAAPWLATAGSGDVLAGFIAGLLARGFSPFDAACTGAWLHVECARRFGPSLIAEDLPEQLPAVFRGLGL